MQPKKKGSVECPLCGWENQKLLASRLRARVLCFPEESCLKNTDTHTHVKSTPLATRLRTVAVTASSLWRTCRAHSGPRGESLGWRYKSYLCSF